uniref:SpoIID/LytB domain-containing protein n=1 Tax=Desertifilum tharense IPPAS B-1220 TaxID=1781255 RepID=A0ACD5GX41_9CYAN
MLARSYALHQREKTRNELFDVGNTTAWQVYKGVEDEYTSTQQYR